MVRETLEDKSQEYKHRRKIRHGMHSVSSINIGYSESVFKADSWFLFMMETFMRGL